MINPSVARAESKLARAAFPPRLPVTVGFAEGVCRGRGVRALHLEVERENTRAQSIYRRAGFVDHDRYLLTKWLS